MHLPTLLSTAVVAVGCLGSVLNPRHVGKNFTIPKPAIGPAAMSFRHPDTGEVTIHQDTGGDLVCDVSRYPTGSHYDVGTLMVLFAMPTYSVIGAHMCERQILYNRTGIYWCNDGDLPVSRPKEDFQTGVAAIQNQCCGQSLAAGDKGVAGMYWFNDPPGSRDNVVLALAIPGTVTDLAPDTIVPNPSEYGMCVT